SPSPCTRTSPAGRRCCSCWSASSSTSTATTACSGRTSTPSPRTSSSAAREVDAHHQEPATFPASRYDDAGSSVPGRPPTSTQRESDLRVTSVLGAGVGLGLITWAIIRPQPVIYLLGVLVTVVSCGDLFVRWRRTRAEQREGQTPASRRARWRAGALAAGLGVVVVAALVAVPLLARWLPTNQGVLWRSADSYGGPVVHAGALYATYYPEEGPGGTSLNRLDLDDGSLSLSIPGHAYLTSEGDIVARVADTIHYYDHNGQQQWTAEVPGDDGTAGVYAAREGTVVVGRCSRDPSDAVVL